MKIISWNVNGIRAIYKKGVFEWFGCENPDILCIQETKAHPEQLDEPILKPDGYHSYWDSAERRGYSGVAVYTKRKPLTVQNGLGVEEFDREGRVLICDFCDFVLYNIYYPNGGAGNKRVPFKLRFYDCFFEHVEKFRKAGKRVVVCGDVNTAHQEIDLARPRENQKNTGFLPEERQWVSKFINAGYTDTFRHFYKEPGHYTWWDYKTRARERDVGWRIDYFFVTANLIDRLENAFILKEVIGSDHCPVGIELK